MNLQAPALPPARVPVDALGQAAWAVLRDHASVLALLAGQQPDWFALDSEARGALRDVADAIADILRRPGAGARPHKAPEDLAASMWAAYVGRIRESGPPELADAIPDWEELPGLELGPLSRDAFIAMARLALEPTQADYDQDAELLGLRGKLAALQRGHDAWRDAANGWEDACRRADADRARLRAELEAIAREEPEEFLHEHGPTCELNSCELAELAVIRDRARQALEVTGA